MSHKPILDPSRSYTFSNYFDLDADPFDLLTEFGYFLTRSPLQLPHFSEPLEQVNFLKERIDNILPYVDLTVVLQKLSEDRKPLWQELKLCNYPKDLIDKDKSLFDGSPGNTNNLSFSNHVQSFISPNGSSCSVEGAKSHSWFD